MFSAEAPEVSAFVSIPVSSEMIFANDPPSG